MQKPQQSPNIILSQEKVLKAKLLQIKPWTYKPKKSLFTVIKDDQNKTKYESFHWCRQQNQRYISFLSQFKEVIEGEKKMRRKWHLNRIMSKHVKTRSYQQCRNHHQKMIKNYHTVQGIIRYLAQQCDQSNPQQQVQHILDSNIFEENTQKTIEVGLDVFQVINWQEDEDISVHILGDFNDTL